MIPSANSHRRFMKQLKRPPGRPKAGGQCAALSQSAQAPVPEMQLFHPNARGSKRWCRIIARCEDSYRQSQWSCQ